MKHHKFLIPVLGLPVSMHLCAQTSIGSDGWEQAQFELGPVNTNREDHPRRAQS